MSLSKIITADSTPASQGDLRATRRSKSRSSNANHISKMHVKVNEPPVPNKSRLGEVDIADSAVHDVDDVVMQSLLFGSRRVVCAELIEADGLVQIGGCTVGEPHHESLEPGDDLDDLGVGDEAEVEAQVGGLVAEHGEHLIALASQHDGCWRASVLCAVSRPTGWKRGRVLGIITR